MSLSANPELARIFPCKICAESDRQTPLEFALETLRISDSQLIKDLIGRVVHEHPNKNRVITWFGEGWDAGFKDYDTVISPWLATRLNFLAWLVGFVSGGYAANHNFKTPVCMYADTGEHGVIARAINAAFEDAPEDTATFLSIAEINRRAIEKGVNVGESAIAVWLDYHTRFNRKTDSRLTPAYHYGVLGAWKGLKSDAEVDK